MKKTIKTFSKLFLLLELFLCPFLLLAGTDATITGSRVNVRVRPQLNSEIVAQVSRDEIVEVLEEGEEWTKIMAPKHSRCWVHSDYVTKGRINTDSVNLRCGAGMAFPVVCKLYEGTPVALVEVSGKWTRIEPPVEFGVWINSKYIDYVDTKKKKQQEKKRKQEKRIIPKKEDKVCEVALKESKAEIREEPVVPTVKSKKKNLPSNVKPVVSVSPDEISNIVLMSFVGRLEDLGVLLNRPGTYKLVGADQWICILKSPTIELNPYVDHLVRIEGVIISRVTSWGVPVVEVKRLQVIE